MTAKHKLLLLQAGLAALFWANPASAQIFWMPSDYTGRAAAGLEPDLGLPLPNATAAEQKAAVAWNMRSGLNVAALQCGFSPTSRTLENYNGILRNHEAELAQAFKTLSGYFKRVSKTPAVGQKALDTYGTRTYSGFSAVAAQLDFCHVAGRVSSIGLYAPKGAFSTFSLERLRELRNGLVRKGEQQFRRASTLYVPAPRMVASCWKKNKYICD